MGGGRKAQELGEFSIGGNFIRILLDFSRRRLWGAKR